MNLFAQAALLLWPVVVIALFARLPLPSALVWSVVGGYLLLPEATLLDLPMLPTWSKELIPSAAALVAALAFQRSAPKEAPRWNQGWLPRNVLARALVFTYILVTIPTSLTNSDAILFSGAYIPGISLYDIGSSLYSQVSLILPFLLARRYLSTGAEQAMLLRVLALAGVAYTFPMLYEIRMSPQLHSMIYGFRPFSFAQQYRGGDFRPVVFLNHGLWTALFIAIAIIAAISFARVSRPPIRTYYALAALWLGLTLSISNSLGALLLVLLFAPIAMLPGKRLRLAVAASAAAVVLIYPMLRSADVVPTETILSGAYAISTDRGESLETRFDNEDILLERANERPAFGWGGWGRSRVYNEWGQDISITDGRWVITFGSFGWTGYIAEFGLLTLPILLTFLRRRREDLTEIEVGLCLVLALNLIDLIPNSTLTPLTWLLAGATLGRLEHAPQAVEDSGPSPLKRRRRGPVLGGSLEGRSNIKIRSVDQLAS